MLSKKLCVTNASITCAFDPYSFSPACVRFYRVGFEGSARRDGRSKPSIVVREARTNSAAWSLFNLLPNWVVRSGGCARKRGHVSFRAVAFLRGFEVQIATDAVDVSVIDSSFASGAKLRLVDMASWYCPRNSPVISVGTKFEKFDKVLFRLVSRECKTILANGTRDPSSLIVVDASDKKEYKGPFLRAVSLLHLLGISRACIVCAL
jgi:hypothetical protein